MAIKVPKKVVFKKRFCRRCDEFFDRTAKFQFICENCKTKK